MGEKGWDVRRPEARAFRWWSLIQHHRDAVGNLMGLMRSSVNALPDPVEPSRRPRRWLGAPMQERASQLAFLDGARGTGKTSVQLSLRRALHSPEGIKAMAKMPDGLASELRAEVQSLRDTAQAIEPHLVWLPSMDMEPLPEGVNALAAILVRLEYVIGEMGQMLPGRRGWLANDSEGEALVSALDSLRRDVVHAWDGGMRQRSPGQDMHSWADEVLGAERARLDINGRLTDLLDHIAWVRRQRGLPNTLFVQVVDDFDLSPSLCVEILRVVRMVTTPRLFFIFAGDLDMASDVMHLKALGDGHRLLGQSANSSQVEARLQRMASSTSANNLRKLVPPRHRVRLRSLEVEEALSLRLPDRNLTLEEALDGLSYRFAGGRRSVLDMLRGPWRGLAPETPEADIRPYRSFLGFLRAPVRALIDSEAMLRALFDRAADSLAEELKPPSSVEVAYVLAEELRRRIAEASVAEVSPNARDSLIQTAGALGLSGFVVLDTETTESTVEAGRIKYIIVKRHQWMAQWMDPLTNTPERAELPTSLGIGLGLIHDLVASAPLDDRPLGWSAASHVLRPGQGAGNVVHGDAEDFLEIPWPGLVWSSIGDRLLFDQLWSRVATVGPLSPRYLLQHWLKTWVAIESGKHQEALSPFSVASIKNGLHGGSGDAAAVVRRQQVFSMLAPEMGWPEAVVSTLVAELELGALIGEGATARWVNDLRTHRLNVSNTSDDLLRSLPLLSPRARTEYLAEAAGMLHQIMAVLDNVAMPNIKDDEKRLSRVAESRKRLASLSELLLRLDDWGSVDSAEWARVTGDLESDLLLVASFFHRSDRAFDRNAAALRFVLEHVAVAEPGAFNRLADGALCPSLATLQRDLRWPGFEPFDS